MGASGGPNGARIEVGDGGGWRLAGELTLGSVGRLWARGLERLAGASTPIEVDLAGIERSDSAGLALLVAWIGEGRARGVELRLRNPPAQMRTLAGATGLDDLLG